jgi:hypothetical protein
LRRGLDVLYYSDPMMTAADVRSLELFVRADPPRGWHLYAQGASLRDFGALFGRDLRGLQVLVYRMPADLLNGNYWEPLTKETENTVREKMTGLVTRTEGDRVLVWRADRIAKHRLLRDGLDVPVELLQGYVFRTTGEGLLALAKAWNGRGRFEWAGLTGAPAAEIHASTLSAVHADLAQFRLSRPEEAFLYAAQGDGLVRTAFPKIEQFRKALDAELISFIKAAVPRHFSHFTPGVLDQIARVGDGLGFSAEAARDVVDKGRTVELNMTLGRTPWGVTVSRDPLAGDDKALLYYDQMSGIWAVAT